MYIALLVGGWQRTVRQFDRYVIVGICLFPFQALTFYLFVFADVWPLDATIIVFFLQAWIKFDIHRNWTYRSGGDVRRQKFRYWYWHLLILVPKLEGVEFCIDALGYSDVVAYVLTACVLGFSTFLAGKIIFPKNKRPAI